MGNSVKPWPFYKEPIYYTGLVTLIFIGLFLYSVFGENFSSNWITVFILSALVFGGLTYFMWRTKCPNCKRPFVKKEKLEWKEDLGTRKEPYKYYSKVYEYSDGTTEKVPGSEKTIMRDKKYDKHYYICRKCGYGSEKEWNEETGKWLGEDPKPKRIKVKGDSMGFGPNLFEEDSYEHGGKRKTIPKGVKEDLWIRHFGKRYKGNCFVCGDKIETKKFEAGHVVPVSKGGTDKLSNLKPICSKCNKGMSNMNLYKYKKKYYQKNKK